MERGCEAQAAVSDFKVAHTIEELRAVVTVPGTILVDSTGLAHQYHPLRFAWGDWLEIGDERPANDDEMAAGFDWPAVIVWEPLPEQFFLMKPIEDPESIECSWCHAKVREPCRNGFNILLRRHHDVRGGLISTGHLRGRKTP